MDENGWDCPQKRLGVHRSSASIVSENRREKAPGNIWRNSAICVHAYSEAKLRLGVYPGRLAPTDGTFAKGVAGKAQASALSPPK